MLAAGTSVTQEDSLIPEYTVPSRELISRPLSFIPTAAYSGSLKSKKDHKWMPSCPEQLGESRPAPEIYLTSFLSVPVAFPQPLFDVK